MVPTCCRAALRRGTRLPMSRHARVPPRWRYAERRGDTAEPPRVEPVLCRRRRCRGQTERSRLRASALRAGAPRHAFPATAQKRPRLIRKARSTDTGINRQGEERSDRPGALRHERLYFLSLPVTARSSPRHRKIQVLQAPAMAETRPA